MVQIGENSGQTASQDVLANAPETKTQGNAVAPVKAAGTGKVRQVKRKTELRNIAESFTDNSAIRRRTERELRSADPDIPYYSAEEALRSLVCAIMEREDRLYDDLYIRWNDMKHRVGSLEDEVEVLKKVRTGAQK